MKAYFVLFLAIFLVSCRNSRQEEMSAVKSMVGKEISFPEDMTFQVLAEPVVPDLETCGFKIVNYVDSGGCTSCRMKLQQWGEFIDRLKTLPDRDIEVLTIVSGRKIGEVLPLLDRFGFRHPVAIDSAGVFFQTNSLPDAQACHTFLLDSDNTVVAIGNPVSNPKIRELYMKIIADGDTLPAEADCGLVQYPVRSLGVVARADTVRQRFKVVNKDSVTCHIQELVPSCHCTVASVSDTIVRPGEDADITVTYLPDSVSTTFLRYVDVFYKEKTNPERLVLYGFIK